jgi:hypothetical protein
MQYKSFRVLFSSLILSASIFLSPSAQAKLSIWECGRLLMKGPSSLFLLNWGKDYSESEFNQLADKADTLVEQMSNRPSIDQHGKLVDEWLPLARKLSRQAAVALTLKGVKTQLYWRDDGWGQTYIWSEILPVKNGVPLNEFAARMDEIYPRIKVYFQPERARRNLILTDDYPSSMLVRPTVNIPYRYITEGFTENSPGYQAVLEQLRQKARKSEVEERRRK